MRYTALLALTLTGCAAPDWHHPQYGTSRLQQDSADCDLMAQTATANMRVGAARGIRLAEITNACLRQRGYQ